MKNKNNNRVMCPLVNKMIEDIDCIENRDVVEGLIKESSLPEEYKVNNFRNICKNCKWHNY